MTGKLSREEVWELFGGSIPAAAFALLQQAPDEMLMSDLRQQLIGMAALWRSSQRTFLAQNTLAENARPFYQEGAGGVTVVHGPLQIPVGSLPDERLAGEITMLLNLGYETYVQRWKDRNGGHV